MSARIETRTSLLLCLAIGLVACPTLPEGLDRYCPDDPLRRDCPSGDCDAYPCIAYCVLNDFEGGYPESGMGSWCDDIDPSFSIADVCRDRLDEPDYHWCSTWCVENPEECDLSECGDDLCSGSETAADCPEDCPAICGDRACTHDETANSCNSDCPAICGDGFCTHDETYESCPEECSESCGNERCEEELGETATTCQSDCPARCGDDACTHDENARSCEEDCPAVCGDDACTHDENADGCEEDCPSVCPDGSCTHDETALSCPADCDALCGDDACTHDEDPSSCPDDCDETCGDDICSHAENAARCPQDCPATCGDGACTHDENAGNCEDDCPASCGDSACTHDENADSCDDDCPAVCGDGFVTHDEDCDGDETGSCTTSCDSIGTHQCMSCSWGACQPPDESCNGLDDDCDGSPDNGFECVFDATQTCTTTCGSTGSRQCNASCEWPPSCTPPSESCNGLDDDCDGSPDNGFECVLDAVESCTTTCGSTGSHQCDAGCEWPPSCTPPSESCNGLDDDCDGSPDNGFECVFDAVRECTTSCDTTGSQTCDSDCEWPTACEPPRERCNGFDDDCDSTVDEFCGCRFGWATEPPPMSFPEQFRGMWGAAWDDIFVVTNRGVVWHYDGTGWDDVEVPAPPGYSYAALNDVWGSAPDDVYVVGFGGYIAHFDGASWTRRTAVTENDLFAIWGFDEDNIYAVGSSGTILFSNGSSWLAQTSGTTRKLNDVWGWTADDVVAVGDSGTIRVYNGSSWSSGASVGSRDINTIWGLSSNIIFAAGDEFIAHTTDINDPSDWSVLGVTSEEFLDIRGGDDGLDDVFAVGIAGVIYRYEGLGGVFYDPGSWSNMTSPTSSTITSLFATGDGPSNLYVVSDRIYHRCGHSW